MQKIMFNDRYGLTQAVLNGTKTMTRRVIKDANIIQSLNELADIEIIKEKVARYKLDETVAVAQSYKAVFEETLDYAIPRYHWLDDHIGKKGFLNKMFVKANEMPHQIQITGIKIERLQDITDDECLKEGIRLYTTGIPQCKTQVVGSLDYIPPYGFDDYRHKHFCNFDNPREAFATLINRPGVGCKGLWEENPWVVAYEFKLIK